MGYIWVHFKETRECDSALPTTRMWLPSFRQLTLPPTTLLRARPHPRHPPQNCIISCFNTPRVDSERGLSPYLQTSASKLRNHSVWIWCRRIQTTHSGIFGFCPCGCRRGAPNRSCSPRSWSAVSRWESEHSWNGSFDLLAANLGKWPQYMRVFTLWTANGWNTGRSRSTSEMSSTWRLYRCVEESDRRTKNETICKKRRTAASPKTSPGVTNSWLLPWK